MTPFQIALWKHFIKDKGMATVFINLYRKNHLKENPISIEEYMRNVEPQDVCMKAFRFYVNSDYGYDYWSKITLMWMEFLAMNENNYTADEWYKLTGMSKILRTNWDAARHWREETKLTAAMRLGIDLSLIGCENKPNTAQPTELSEEYLRERTKHEMDELDEVNGGVKTDEPKRTGSFLGEFELLSVRPKARGKRRLQADEISINLRDKRGRITFNQYLSKEISERGGYEYASLMRNKKGEVLLWLNDTDKNGVNVIDGYSDKNKNVNITSKVMVEKIATFLNIKNDYEIIKVTEVEKTNKYVAYLLTKIND